MLIWLLLDVDTYRLVVATVVAAVAWYVAVAALVARLVLPGAVGDRAAGRCSEVPSSEREEGRR